MRTRKVFVSIHRVSVSIVILYISMLPMIVIVTIICMLVSNDSIFSMLLHHI